MRGCHLLRFWSKTQASIAQSSAESELFGAVRGGVEALGAPRPLTQIGGISVCFGDRVLLRFIFHPDSIVGRRGAALTEQGPSA